MALLNDQVHGVSAAAEARLEALAPLIEFYSREMGELPGRLMIATSFLSDAQLTIGWPAQTPEARQAIEQAQALIVSVMVRLLSIEGDCSCDSDTVRAEMQRLLDRS
jgi:hypothetical protein